LPTNPLKTGSQSDSYRTFGRYILVVATGLRLLLALVNREANDAHIPVIKSIAFDHHFPTRDEMWEGFQPKLFHTVAALIWRVLPNDLTWQIISAQMLNALAGVLTIWIIFRFLTGVQLSTRVRLLALALFALNPALIGINSQVTNDSFVILFSTAALYFGFRYFKEFRTTDWILMTASTCLAVLSKGNGIVVLIALICTGIAQLGRLIPSASEHRMRRAASLAVLVLIVIGSASVLGPYYDHYRRYGTPFVTNYQPDPLPHWSTEPTPHPYPGVTTVKESFFTFRLFNLIRHPHQTQMRWGYPRHRRSLWSQLYGGWNYAQFPSAPNSWQADSKRILFIGKILMVLAFLPACIFVVGLVRQLGTVVRGALKREKVESRATFLLVIVTLGFLLFEIAYSARYHEYTVMKPIFIFPGLLGFLAVFATACDEFYQAISSRWARIADFLLWSLAVVYSVDVIVLTKQISSFPFVTS
jgi:Dolichyl-phosphate-mannose-protein mannosyltransferase